MSNIDKQMAEAADHVCGPSCNHKRKKEHDRAFHEKHWRTHEEMLAHLVDEWGIAGVIKKLLEPLDNGAQWEVLGVVMRGYHVVEIKGDSDAGDWAIQHPLSCRPNLLDCKTHKWVNFCAEAGILWTENHITEAGRYQVEYDMDVQLGQSLWKFYKLADGEEPHDRSAPDAD